MSGSSKPATTTVNQINEPYKPAMPALQNILDASKTAFQSGVGSQVYEGDRVAGFGGDTLSAIDKIRQLTSGGASAATQAGTNFNNNLIGSGGMSAGSQGALAQLQNVGGIDVSALQRLLSGYGSGNSVTQTADAFQNGGRDINTEGDYRNLFAQTQGPGSVETNLADAASGKFLSGGNPYLDALINQSSTDAANQVAARFSGSGRYGSGAFSGAIADATGKIATQTRAAEYDQERARQVEAAQAIDAAKAGRIGLGSNLLGAIGGVQGQNNQQRLAGAGLQQSQTAQQLGALGQMSGLEQFNTNLGMTKAQNALTANQNATQSALAAVGNIPMLNQQAMDPAQTLLQLGTFQDANRQASIDATRQKFQEQQEAPWKQLGLYQAAALPIAQTGSQTNGTTTQYAAQPSGLQSALGTATAGVGLLGKLFGSTGAMGTGASLASSIGSALPSLLAFSDERLKEDIEKVGKLDNGQSVYAYRYKDGGPRQIGLLAQEVEKSRPEAVATHPSGFKMVDYGLATAKKRAA